MHYAKLATSDRLQKAYRALKIRPLTTYEIIHLANVCAVNSIISELRANGIKISCKPIRKGVYLYSLEAQ